MKGCEIMAETKELTLFEGITEDHVEKMTQCFDTVTQVFQPKDTIMTYSDHLEKIGILTEGTAFLYTLDFEGRCNILEYFHAGDVFGEIFTLPIRDQGFFIEAESPCTVLFIQYSQLVKRCENACLHHSQLVSNLFQMVAKKSQQQTLHLNILSQRNMRSKLLVYFSYLHQLQNTNPIQLPMSYTSLANYLCVDRSAMMRELKQMKLANLIATEGTKVTLLEQPVS